MKRCYLLLENLENGEKIFHGKFYKYEMALQLANKNLTTDISFAYPPFLILEAWEVTE